MLCPVHGEVPTDQHHTPVLRKDGGTETEPWCRYCHQEHHRKDDHLHRPGYEALKAKIVSWYFRDLRLKLSIRLHEEGVDETEYMSKLGKAGNRKRWAPVRAD